MDLKAVPKDPMTDPRIDSRAHRFDSAQNESLSEGPRPKLDLVLSSLYGSRDNQGGQFTPEISSLTQLFPDGDADLGIQVDELEDFLGWDLFGAQKNQSVTRVTPVIPIIHSLDLVLVDCRNAKKKQYSP